MDLMVTHDSLWSHFSAALGVPQVLLASCTDGQLLSKGYPDVSVVQRDWDCVPCWYRFKEGGCIYSNYPRCLDDVGVDEVMTKVSEALSDE
jgi:ADP-heptose:LPS heptosyltransferase